jgi:hypothetical protein
LRLLGTAAAASAVAVVATGTLGVAAAEAPTISTIRTVSVGGVAIVPVAQNATEAAATAAYRQAMAAAVNDGQAKAQFLAEKTGVALGPVQSVAEGGGSIECTGGAEPGGYAEYEGGQPDFSSGSSPAPVQVLRSAAAPSVKTSPVKHKAKKKRKRHAKAAVAVTCKLSAQVSLVYGIA